MGPGLISSTTSLYRRPKPNKESAASSIGVRLAPRGFSIVASMGFRLDLGLRVGQATLGRPDQPATRPMACSPGWSAAEPRGKPIGLDHKPRSRPQTGRSNCLPPSLAGSYERSTQSHRSASLHPGLYPVACFAVYLKRTCSSPLLSPGTKSSLSL